MHIVQIVSHNDRLYGLDDQGKLYVLTLNPCRKSTSDEHGLSVIGPPKHNWELVSEGLES